jgi:hypothetical protein
LHAYYAFPMCFMFLIFLFFAFHVLCCYCFVLHISLYCCHAFCTSCYYCCALCNLHFYRALCVSCYCYCALCNLCWCHPPYVSCYCWCAFHILHCHFQKKLCYCYALHLHFTLLLCPCPSEFVTCTTPIFSHFVGQGVEFFLDNSISSLQGKFFSFRYQATMEEYSTTSFGIWESWSANEVQKLDERMWSHQCINKCSK